MVVEVFKTNVFKVKDAKRLLSLLNSEFPLYKINFDLQDRDKILRVEPHSGAADIRTVMKILNDQNFYCEILPDN